MVPSTTTTGFANAGYVSNQAPATQYNNPQYPSATQYGNPQYPPPQPTQYGQYPAPSQHPTGNSTFNQAPPAYGYGDYDGNQQFGQFTAKY